jgi:hypothetical protein
MSHRPHLEPHDRHDHQYVGGWWQPFGDWPEGWSKAPLTIKIFEPSQEIGVSFTDKPLPIPREKEGSKLWNSTDLNPNDLHDQFKLFRRSECPSGPTTV